MTNQLAYDEKTWVDLADNNITTFHLFQIRITEKLQECVFFPGVETIENVY